MKVHRAESDRKANDWKALLKSSSCQLGEKQAGGGHSLGLIPIIT